MNFHRTRFFVWTFLYLSFLGAASAHDVDMPPWVKGSATCSLDIHSKNGAAEIELGLNRQDAVLLSGDKDWKGKATLARIAEKVKPSFFLNGQIPSEVLILEHSTRFERWLLKWPAPAPASFELKTIFFQGLASPAWCRVFMFPDYGDPERSFFFPERQVFPLARG